MKGKLGTSDVRNAVRAYAIVAILCVSGLIFSAWWLKVRLADGDSAPTKPSVTRRPAEGVIEASEVTLADSPVLAKTDRASGIPGAEVESDAVGDTKETQAFFEWYLSQYSGLVRRDMRFLFDDLRRAGVSESVIQRVLQLTTRRAGLGKLNATGVAAGIFDDQAAANRYCRNARLSIELELSQILGPSAYVKCEYALQGAPYVRIADGLGYVFESKGWSLSESQKASLVEICHREYNANFVRIRLPRDSGGMDDMEIAKDLAKRRKADAEVLRRIAGVLSEGEIEVLRRFLEMQISGIEQFNGG